MAPQRELIRATSLADEIAFRLQSAILDGTYPPGTPMLQDELCERFGVSRTPVREALRKLQAQQLVVLIPNKGAKVRVPERQDLIDVYAVRSQLEGWACELAAACVDESLIAELDQSGKVIEEIVGRSEAGDGATDDEASQIEFTAANEAFHGAIARASGNQRLCALIIDLERFFPPKNYVWRAIQSGDESRELNVEEHRRVYDALLVGDGLGARREMERHIHHAGELLLAYLDSHAFWK